MEVPNQTLAKLLDQSRQLYTLPGVALRVLELTNNPQVDAAELKACIERDPALTIKVLRVVNSSLFGMSRRVSDLNQALTLLGTKPLKLLVLGFSLPDQLFADLAGDVLSRYWRHTLTRAVAARELSERLWKVPGDEVFVAGLLKDLGRLVLIQGLGRPYVEFLRRADFSRG
ncbi:MAG TPA: HDOD domain-containing protein, partial [Pirellulales bacterium]